MCEMLLCAEDESQAVTARDVPMYCESKREQTSGTRSALELRLKRTALSAHLLLKLCGERASGAEPANVSGRENEGVRARWRAEGSSSTDLQSGGA